MSTDRSMLPPELRKALQAELAPGERLLYAAMPDWRAERGKLAAILLFGIFWSSIAFFFFLAPLASLLGFHPLMTDGRPTSWGLQFFILIFSVPFVAIGCVLLAVPFLGVRKSRHTVHAVTDARVLNVYTGKDKGAEYYPLMRLNFIKRKDGPAGTGNLEIGYGVEKDSDGDPRPLTLDWPGIPDVKRAEQIIRDRAKWVR